jgi:hypothetical protein
MLRKGAFIEQATADKKIYHQLNFSLVHHWVHVFYI